MGIFDRLRMLRARQRFMPLPRTVQRGTTAIVAVAIIALTIAISLVLGRRGAGREDQIVAWAESRAEDPVGLVLRETRSRPLLLLGDVIGARGPKRFAAALIDTLGRAGRLDAVALEVPADQQTWIDIYLETDPEDTSVLIAHPRTIREDEGAGRALLEVYRAVWRVNQSLGANRRIRIWALDPPSWPPPPGYSPARAVTAFAQRDTHMVAVLESRILTRSPRARVLVFVDGLRVQRGRARISTGGITPMEIEWLGSRLAAGQASVLAVLVDAPRGSGAATPIAGHRAGPLHALLRQRMSWPAAGIGLRITPDAGLSAEWLAAPGGPGIELDPRPVDADIARRIDAWVLLPN
jgi:hypothetical protein